MNALLTRIRNLFRRESAVDAAHVKGDHGPQRIGADGEPEALLNQGFVELEAGNAERAEQICRQVLSEAQDYPPAMHLLGTLLGQRGAYDEAEVHLKRVAELAPEQIAPLIDLGLVYTLSGRPEAAVEIYQKASAAEPDNPQIHSNLAYSLNALSRFAEARASAEKALAIEPRYPEALVNLGNAQQMLGDLDKARECFERAIEFSPEYAVAHNNLGNVHLACERHEAAIQAYERAAELEPGFDEALSNLGVALQARGRVDEARASFERAIAIRPSLATRARHALTLPAIMESDAHIDETRANLGRSISKLMESVEQIADPFKAIGMPHFFLSYHGRDNHDLHTALADFYIKSCPALGYVASHCETGVPGHHSRILVGFVSTFFRNHTIGHLMRGIIAQLDKQRFEIVLFMFPQADDEMSRSFRQAADRVVELPFDLSLARSLVEKQTLDVLFYPDIGMHAITYFLAFARLAPVQCVTWGHPDTTGIPNIDYFLSSTVLESQDSDQQYSETLVRLPHLNFYYDQPPVPQSLKERKQFGLDPDANLYLCPQSLFKIHPAFDKVLAQILQRDPKGRIVFIAGHSPLYTKLLQQRLRRVLGNETEKVQFLPPVSQIDYVNLAAVSDVALDPLHFSGGRSTAEILATGTPVVTLPDEFLRSRVTLGCYRCVGVTEFVVEDTESYADVAVKLATDKEYQREVRASLLDAVPQLYDNRESVTQLEEFFQSLST